MRIRSWFDEKAAEPRYIFSRFPGHCRYCGKTINVNDEILWIPLYGVVYCRPCGPEVQKMLRGE